jgi:hypothetical protein
MSGDQWHGERAVLTQDVLLQFPMPQQPESIENLIRDRLDVPRFAA